MKALYNELGSYTNVPTCSYDASKDIVSFIHQDYVMQFLLGLNETYARLHSQNLLQEPLPPVENVCLTLLQEKKQHALSSIMHTHLEALTLATITGGPHVYSGCSTSKGRYQYHFTHCDKDGMVTPLQTVTNSMAFLPKKAGNKFNRSHNQQPCGLTAMFNQALLP